jgi:hypothetical protein
MLNHKYRNSATPSEEKVRDANVGLRRRFGDCREGESLFISGVFAKGGSKLTPENN